MCIWTRSDPLTEPIIHACNNKKEQTCLKKYKKYDYLWDLDDGNPGLIKQTKRDYLKLYLDSDQDGYLTRSDELIGKTKIKKMHRRKRLGHLIRRTQQGTISAFNSPHNKKNPSSEIGIEHSQDQPPGHIGLDQAVGLKLIHPHGTVVAVFDHLIL
tara:strand:+ start:20 stop:487 length:468 start_codon:yes stop_codon:yes gene_type:complete